MDYVDFCFQPISMCDPPPPNLPLPPRIYPLSNKCICDPPRIYLSVSEYTPLFNKCICATFPEYTPPSQYIHPFSTNVYVRPSRNLPPPFSPTICDPLRIYPSLPEYTPLFNKCICATLPESTAPLRIYPFFNNYVQSFQNLPIPPRIYCNKSTINLIRIIYLIFYNIYFGVFTVAGIHRFPIYLRVIDMLGRQLRTWDLLLGS